MQNSKNTITFLKGILANLQYRNEPINTEYLKNSISLLAELMRSSNTKYPYDIQRESENLERIKLLEDLLFIHKYQLVSQERLLETFSTNEMYDNVLLIFIEKVKRSLEGSDSDIVQARIKEERIELVNLASIVRTPFGITALHSLLRKAIDWLESSLQSNWDNKSTTLYPHHRIFTNPDAYRLFEHLHKQIKRNELAEYSFIYWSMHNDGLIHKGVRPSEFIDWLNDTHEQALPELKQLNNCSGGNKSQNYSTAKLLFKC